MDERQRKVKKSFTIEQLKRMPVDELIALIGEVGPNVKFQGTAVVRKSDGTIRYDNDAIPGDYYELPEDLVKDTE